MDNVIENFLENDEYKTQDYGYIKAWATISVYRRGCEYKKDILIPKLDGRIRVTELIIMLYMIAHINYYIVSD